MADPVQRRLAAILAADVAGYSRLMGEDETGTRARFNAHLHELIEPGIANRQGRIVKTTGDALLVEFASVVDAVECAIEIQRGLAQRNADETDEKRMDFRIGVNLGDVIIEGDDIHGDGVNVAARLEGESAAGGICISSDVYRQVVGKIECAFRDLGELDLKNIASPVHAFQVLIDDAGGSPVGDLELPDKPSIAVLPFENMSGDPEQEYFADGIAEDIITGLSRFHWFFVIARNSSFTYKGSAVDVKRVANELGVQYVLEGSVRKGGNRVRITAQLIDALTGRHVWAERYDRDLDDIFEVQDEISEAITTTVAPAFVSAEAQRAARKAPERFDTWDYCMRGNWYLSRRGRDDLAQAIELFDEALERDVNCTMAYSGRALALGWMINFGWFDDLGRVRGDALSAAQRAVDLDENDAWAHTVLGFVDFFASRLDASLVEYRRALQLNPNLALAEAMLALANSWRGTYDEAAEHAAKAVRLSPRDAHSLGSFASTVAEFGAGRYDQAADWARQMTDANPEMPSGWRYLAASLGHTGRIDEAKMAVDQLLRTSENDSIANTREIFSRLPLASADLVDRVIEGLRRAGLSE